MYRIYFKQSLLMLKQNKFISMIAIMGTALAIMMIMTIIVADEIKGISAPPEINRERTLHTNYQVKKDTTKNSWQSGTLSYDIVKDYLYPLKTPLYISAFTSLASRPSTLTGREGSSEIINAHQRLTDATYWKIFSFSFIEKADSKSSCCPHRKSCYSIRKRSSLSSPLSSMHFLSERIMLSLSIGRLPRSET